MDGQLANVERATRDSANISSSFGNKTNYNCDFASDGCLVHIFSRTANYQRSANQETRSMNKLRAFLEPYLILCDSRFSICCPSYSSLESKAMLTVGIWIITRDYRFVLRSR